MIRIDGSQANEGDDAARAASINGEVATTTYERSPRLSVIAYSTLRGMADGLIVGAVIPIGWGLLVATAEGVGFGLVFATIGLMIGIPVGMLAGACAGAAVGVALRWSRTCVGPAGQRVVAAVVCLAVCALITAPLFSFLTFILLVPLTVAAAVAAWRAPALADPLRG